jgi:serpin B
MRSRIYVVLIAILLVSAACSSSSGIDLAKADVARAGTSPDDAVAAAAAVNAFGLGLYRRVAADGENVVISPASIALALAMARAGARGATAAEMDAVLHEAASDANAAWLNALDLALAGRSGTFKDDTGKEHDVTLRIANATFGQRDMRLLPAYLDALASRFGAGVRLVDYVTQTEAARKLINGWVDDQTEHRIPELLVPGIITTDTRLTLVNAIYLKAAWQTPFAEGETKAGIFNLADGTTVEVPMMATTTELPYAAGDGWRAVELPYIGGSLAMTVILPDDLAAFEAALTPDQLATIVGDLHDFDVTLSFPKFGIETKAMLADVLGALGMPSAFDPGRADFSGITTDVALFISDVVHQANIDVDEKGTTAAAATAVVLRGTAIAEHVTLRVDRPFLFLLHDRPTGTILFLGRVSDPSIGY